MDYMDYMDYADDYVWTSSVKTFVWLALISIIPFIFFGIFVTDPGGSANSPATETSTPAPYSPATETSTPAP